MGLTCVVLLLALLQAPAASGHKQIGLAAASCSPHCNGHQATRRLLQQEVIVPNPPLALSPPPVNPHLHPGGEGDTSTGPLPTSESNADGNLKTPAIVGIAIGVSTGSIALLIALGIWYVKRRNHARELSSTGSSMETSPQKMMTPSAVIRLNINELSKHRLNLIGMPPLQQITTKESNSPPPEAAIEQPIPSASPELQPRNSSNPKSLGSNRAPAPHYTWGRYIACNKTVHVQAGVNDWQMDKLARHGQTTENNNIADCPVQRLSPVEVSQQVELLPNGLTGRGHKSLVFKARWPSRFGEHALLAVKVLNHDADTWARNSFVYEAMILANIQHPNIVRIYGYCLELPTMCIITELLPGTLQERLHPHKGISPGPRSHHNILRATSRNGVLSRELSLSGSAQPILLFTQVSPPPRVSFPGLEPTTSASGHIDDSLSPRPMLRSEPGLNAIFRPSISIPILDSFNPLFIQGVLQLGEGIAAGLASLHELQLPLPLAQTTNDDMASALARMYAPAQAADMASEALYADLKKAKVVHMGLKPTRILISSGNHARIGGFGLIANQHHNNAEPAELAYIAPELWQHMKDPTAQLHSVTSKADVYSLGMILWEMITGQIPWLGLSSQEIQHQVTSGMRPSFPASLFKVGSSSCTDLDSRNSQNGSTSYGLAASHTQPEIQSTDMADGRHVLQSLQVLIESCWAQNPEDRPTAKSVQLSISELLIQPADVAAEPAPLAQ